MFKVRDDEPQYAFLRREPSRQTNQHGKAIELVNEQDERYGQCLNINGSDSLSENPDRYKQHGFHFTADNCIACHACEAACSEKNDNPAHLAFRSVGYVEGGSYPSYQRLNISMACNHCDDPVCLKGCPTRAYTKFAEYGAVLQDPDTCFGCGYCTWVCPYNAPQLDPVKGQVSKCNMCVDRLEVGLKPACVAACLGGALDFGVIENTPENRDQAKLDIPGFPSPDITNPNIRFQQKRSLPREMTRTDSMPLKYHKDDDTGRYQPEVDEKNGLEKEWNWKALLGSHENSHVLFTLCTQATWGAFMLFAFGALIGVPGLADLESSFSGSMLLVAMIVILAFGMFKLQMHLGKPHRFYRGFTNLRYSPVSREIAGVSIYFASLAGYTFLSLFDHPVVHGIQQLFAFAGAVGGSIGLYYMYRIYRIKARPYWDHWQTAGSFFGSALSLGGLLVLVGSVLLLPGSNSLYVGLSFVILVGLALEAIGLYYHVNDLTKQGGEGGAALYDQRTKFGKAYLLRNGLLGLAMLLALAYPIVLQLPVAADLILVLLVISVLAMAIIGRALFYVLVIPTTMPGAFFWRNRGFVEHARDTGMAHMPQVGVVYERHHSFKLNELLETIKENSLSDMLNHVKGVVTGRP